MSASPLLPVFLSCRSGLARHGQPSLMLLGNIRTRRCPFNLAETLQTPSVQARELGAHFEARYTAYVGRHLMRALDGVGAA